MLDSVVMGALALGVLWVNVLLIAAAALTQRSALGTKLASLRAASARGDLVEGEVTSGVLAERRTAQVGRAMTNAGPDRILFTDKATATNVPGGSIRTGSRELTVLDAPAAEVWLGNELPAERTGIDGFDAAWKRASTSRGVELDVVRRAGQGTHVWIAGVREGDALRPTLVASASPLAELARGRRLLSSVALAALVGGAGITAIVLVPPVFGTVSTIGGALGIAFFLLIQPAGVVARNRARTPDRQPVGGIWQRP